MNPPDTTVYPKPDVYDPFHNVRMNGPKERRLFRRAMMGEFDYRKFPQKPKLTRDEVQEYVRMKLNKEPEKEDKMHHKKSDIKMTSADAYTWNTSYSHMPPVK